eukprot:1358024-Amphidinium_carterae.1
MAMPATPAQPNQVEPAFTRQRPVRSRASKARAVSTTDSPGNGSPATSALPLWCPSTQRSGCMVRCSVSNIHCGGRFDAKHVDLSRPWGLAAVSIRKEDPSNTATCTSSKSFLQFA